MKRILKIGIATVLLGGATFVFSQPDSIKPAPPSVMVNGHLISFPYTDDNAGENLLIYTDREDYHELSTIIVYAAVVNASGKTQNVSLQAYTNGRPVEQISKLVKDIPYQVDIPDFATDKTCEQGIDPDGKKVQNCYNKQTGVHQETKYKDEWQTQTLGNAKARLSDSKEVKGVVSKSATVNLIKDEVGYYQIKFKIPPNSGREEFYIEAIGSKGGYGHLDPWFDSNWDYRQEWVIQSAQIAGVLSNFPVAATTTQAVLADTGNGGHMASSTAGDLVFTDWEDNKIDFEIESYNNTTGQLVAWLEVPFVSTTSTRSIYAYYGNASAAYQPTNEATWDANYLAVHHLAETATDEGTAAIHLDAAGTFTAPQSGNEGVAGQFAGANGQDFDATDDIIERARFSTITNNLTMSAWINHSAGATANSRVVYKNGERDDSGGNGYSIWLKWDSGESAFEYGFDADFVAGARSEINIADATWYYVVAERDANTWKLFINGVADGSTPTNNPNAVTDGYSIGAADDPDGNNRFFDGIIDEARFSDIPRTANWVTTEWNNQSAVNEFFTFGSEESQAPAAEDLRYINHIIEY